MNLDFDLEVGAINKLDNSKNLYDLLDVDRKANTLTIKAAYLKQKQMYAKNALALYSLCDDPANDKVLLDLEKAYSVLSCDFSREDYDKELDGSTKAPRVETKKIVIQKQTPKEEIKSISFSGQDKVGQYDRLGQECGFGTGAQLKSFRTWLGIELQEVQHVTKISYTTLESIENESFQLLPDIVYVRGFLRTCLRYYGLPKREEFEKLFMERLKNWKRTSNQ